MANPFNEETGKACLTHFFLNWFNGVAHPVYLGLGCFGYGLWQIYPPLAPVLVGLILIWIAAVFYRQG